MPRDRKSAATGLGVVGVLPAGAQGRQLLDGGAVARPAGWQVAEPELVAIVEPGHPVDQRRQSYGGVPCRRGHARRSRCRRVGRSSRSHGGVELVEELPFGSADGGPVRSFVGAALAEPDREQAPVHEQRFVGFEGAELGGVQHWSAPHRHGP